MVKHRGIGISIVSQVDIQRLTEYDYPPANSSIHDDAGNENGNGNGNGSDGGTKPPNPNSATCFVPIYPGSQIWFEYAIDPPHPPGSMYLFKLFVRGQLIVAWDCTEKHGYCGKAVYVLERGESLGIAGVGSRCVVQRRIFQFNDSNNEEDVEYDQKNAEELEDDMAEDVEILVHRVEHRQRIWNGMAGVEVHLDRYPGTQLKLASGGIAEPFRPLRRYKYQLLDPIDEPYAVFHFLFRSHEYIERHCTPTELKPTVVSSTSSSSDVHSILTASPERLKPSTPNNQTTPYQNDTVKHSLLTSSMTGNRSDRVKLSPMKSLQLENRRSMTDTYLPSTNSGDALSILTKDSIEDLPSTVSRSPESLHRSQSRAFLPNVARQSESPTKKQHISERSRLQNRFALNVSGGSSNSSSETSFSSARQSRALSPFTAGGILRRKVGADSASVTPSPFDTASEQCVYLRRAASGTNSLGERIEQRTPSWRIRNEQQTPSRARSFLEFFNIGRSSDA